MLATNGDNIPTEQILKIPDIAVSFMWKKRFCIVMTSQSNIYYNSLYYKLFKQSGRQRFQQGMKNDDIYYYFIASDGVALLTPL